MWLKYKLARENCIDNLKIDIDKYCMNSCMLCYVAGFDKAKEMSLDALSIRFEDYDKIVSRIMNLGEEEA